MSDIKVFFGVPSYTKHPCYEFCNSMRDTQRMLDHYQIPSIWYEVGGDPYIHKVRNRLVAKFLDDCPGYTHFFFLDDDLGWSPAEAVIRFLQYPFDVVAGIYPKKEDKLNFPVVLAFEKTDDGRVVPIEQQGCYLANLAPTGFMCIQRRVLEAAAADSLEYDNPDPDSPTGSTRAYDIFRTGTVPFYEGAKKGKWWGEDYFFCAIAKALGFSVWVDPNIEFTHRGSKPWKATFNDTLQKKIVQLVEPTLPVAAE